VAHSSPSGVEEVVWRVLPIAPPRILRHCPRCERPRSFASTDRFRLNAQQRRIDVWLVYRCIECEAPWKREILRRGSPEQIGADLHRRFQYNDRHTAWHYAFTPPPTGRLEGEVAVHVERPPGKPAPPLRLRLEVPFPCGVRLERLLAAELDVGRAALRLWAESGALDISPGGARALRRPARDGVALLFAGLRGPSP
jgi:hypothetical protein